MAYRGIYLIMLVILHLHASFSIWPPPYKINLTDEENFIIFETFGSERDDDLYNDDDEMIRKPDIKSFNIDGEEEKYFRIHRMAMKWAAIADNSSVSPKKPRQIKWQEHDYYKKEPIPWTAGFQATDQMENSNVFYLNQMAQSVIEDTIDRKRADDSSIETDKKIARKGDATKDVVYDYNAFREDFANDIKTANKSNNTLNFVDVPDEDSVLQKMNPFKKTPRNCTKEELSGIGIAAAECFWIDFQKKDTKEQRFRMAKRISIIVLIWFCVYLIIAISCWCHRGWCCCCFQCRCCKPRLRIDEVKAFMANNPPGVYNDGENLINYKPSHYEIYAYRRLEHALMKL